MAETTTRAAARERGYSIQEWTNGRVRVRIQLPPGPDGKAKEATRILPTREEGHAWAQKILTEVRDGTHIQRAPDTFDGRADEWLASREGAIRPVTIRGYRSALGPAREAFGHKRVQDITPADVRALMRSLARRGKATNQLTLIAVRNVFALALDDELIRVNPAAKVKNIGQAARSRDELPAADADRIAAHIRGDRLEGCWQLTLAGLRRSEVMGLRWSDLDTEAGTVSVARGRLEGKEYLEPTPTKSARGRRVLPLPEPILAALTRTRAIRAAEHLALGVSWDERSFIAVDEALRPLRPEFYSDSWGRLLEAAGCESRVTLHGARHGSVTRMLDRGVPVHIAAAWHGHDPAIALRVYAHADLKALALAGDALHAGVAR